MLPSKVSARRGDATTDANRASGTVRPHTVRLARWGDGGRLAPHVHTTPLSAHPVGGTSSGGRSAAGQLGVAV
eukprot:6953569-Prymnesium_polylepis.1